MLVVQNLLHDTEEFVRTISRVYHIAGIVGIPYSAKKDVVRRLAKDFPTIVPKTLDGMEGAIHSILEGSSSPMLILDVLRNAARLATTPRLPIAGIVEETNQGHWRYANVAADLQYPVLSIAQSRPKQVEHLTVGPAIVFSTDKILRDELKDSLQRKNALVLGYGNVGRGIARALWGLSATVSVFDTDPVRLIEARLQGFRIGPKAELLRVADVVFGATGRRALGQEDFDLLASGVYLVSGSSRQVEFDVAALESTGTKERLSPSLTRFRLGDKEVFLVNEGFPVNFRDTSIPMAIADLVFAEALLALRTVTSKPPGFHVALPLDLENEICRHWLQSYLGLVLF